MNYVFHPAAAAEHLESVAFFESKRPGLGASYLSEFEGVMAQACHAPHRYPVTEASDIRYIRRYLIGQMFDQLFGGLLGRGYRLIPVG